MMRAHCFILLLLTVILGGCANYRYVLLEPAADAPRIIDGKGPVHLPFDPLEYRFAEVDDYLWMRIANPNDAPVALQDNRSYVIDPQGESHPLPGSVIAPHAYVDLMLPTPPRVYRVRGYGWSHPYPYYGRYYYGRGRRGIYPYYPYGYGRYSVPQTYYVSEPGPYSWTWGTGTARIHLGYEWVEERQGTFKHELVIRRERVK